MNHRPALLAAALAALFTLPAVAAVETAPPPPAAPKAVNIPAASESTLANGLRVIVVHREGLPLVTMDLLLRSGSEVDPTRLPGTASMVADLLTQGTTSRTAPEIAETAAALGGSIGAGAGWDRTRVGMTVTTPRAEAALDLLADVVRHPAFKADEIERVRKRATDGLRVSLRQPAQLASLVAQRAVFGGAGYGHPADGTPTSVAAITRDDLVALHDTWYRPDNAVLVFAGDITPSAATALAKRAFGDWARPDRAMPQPSTETVAATLPARLAINLAGSGQAGVVVGHSAIARDAADYYSGVVANMVLGGSYSARMNEEIRIKRGLSYGARSSLDALRGDGWLATSVQTKNPSAAEVVSLSLQQIASLATDPPADDELAARKATLIGTFGRRFDTTAGLASAVGELAVDGIALDEVNHFIDKVQAVSATDVADFARKHLADKGNRVVVVGDAGQYGEALKKLWPDVTPIDADALDLDQADLGLGKK